MKNVVLCPVYEKLLLSIPEACSLLGYGRNKLYDLINRGDLRVVRDGRTVRITRREIDRWLSDKETKDGKDDLHK